MFIHCVRPRDIHYKYVSSLDNDNYVIKVKKYFLGMSTDIKCDYYDFEGAAQEVLSLDDDQQREVIPAYEIVDCPTLKGFYIVRE